MIKVRLRESREGVYIVPIKQINKERESIRFKQRKGHITCKSACEFEIVAFSVYVDKISSKS